MSDLNCNFAYIKQIVRMKFSKIAALSLGALVALAATDVRADVIILKDATNLTAYNVELAGSWILYTADESADSPLQRVAADKVFGIKSDAGELQTVAERFGASVAAPAATLPQGATDGPMPVEPEAAADNATRLALYNSPVLSLKKPKSESDKEKLCTDFLTVWGVTSGSVLSDANLQIDFVMTMPTGASRKSIPQYKVKVTNKTARPIYIDLANSFKFNADGSAEPYFTNSVYSEGGSSSRGVSLNMGSVAGALGVGGALGTLAGGVGIGAGAGKSASVSTAEQRILMIPPKGSVFMPPMKYVDGSSMREDYESLYIRTFPLGGALTTDGDMRRADANKGYVHMVDQPGGIDDARLTRDVIKASLGHIREFSETDTPKQLRRIVTYSTEPDFATYTCVEYTLYVRGVMGSNMRWNVPADYNTNYLTTDDPEHLLLGVGVVKK